jgi:uncharacterized membrane protein YkoI
MVEDAMQTKHYGLMTGGLLLGLLAGMTISLSQAEQSRPTIQLPDNWVVTEAPDTVKIETREEAAGVEQTRIPVQDIIHRVEEEYGGKVIKVELDRRPTEDVYQIELRDAQGDERKIHVNAYSGEILHGAPGQAATGQEHIPMQDIISRFEQEYDGRVVEIELEHENTHDEYEIELIDAQGIKWKIDVDAHTGEVLKRERDKRVAATAEADIFEGHIPMQEIISRVEKEYNGRVIEIELERESYHDEYEIKLLDAQGEKWKIEIDAHSGELLKRKRD